MKNKIELKPVLDYREMCDFIDDNNLRDWNGVLDYNDAKEIASASDKWVLTEIPLSHFDWVADSKYRNKSKGLPPIVLKNDESFEVLDGKHRIGMAKHREEQSILVYLGENPD